MVKLYQCWKMIKGRTKQNKKWKDVMRKQRKVVREKMNDDQHKSVQIKKNHITNGGMVEKTNDPKTLVKIYSTLISNTYHP